VKTEKPNSQRINKVRLFDILTRVVTMNEEESTTITWQFDHALVTLNSQGNKGGLPGLIVTFPYNEQEDEDRVSTEVKLRIDSEDWEFDEVEKRLDALDEEHRLEKARQNKRDNMLRHMTEEERELMGYKSWRDPDPDGPARVLAERALRSKTKTSKLKHV
jgi:hypothetical protein